MKNQCLPLVLAIKVAGHSIFFIITGRFFKMVLTHTQQTASKSTGGKLLASSWSPTLLPNLLLLQEESKSPLVKGLVPLPFVKFVSTRKALSCFSLGNCQSVYFWHLNPALIGATYHCIKKQNY